MSWGALEIIPSCAHLMYNARPMSEYLSYTLSNRVVISDHCLVSNLFPEAQVKFYFGKVSTFVFFR